MSRDSIQKTLQRAIVHHGAGRLSEAEALYGEVRVAAPRNFDAFHLSGLLAHQQGRSVEAVKLLGRAIQLNPRSDICEMRLGLALLGNGEASKAESRLRTVLARQPAHADGWEALALAVKLQDRLEEAVACHRRSVALRPSDATGWSNFGLTLSSLGRFGEALACHERALAADPDSVAARFGRAQALQQSLRVPEAIAEFEGVVRRAPERLDARSFRLLALHYLDGIPRERLFEEHLAYGRALGRPGTRVFPNGRELGMRLRVAILSPDFRSHACAYFIEPIIRNLDPARFEIVLYLDHFREDRVSARLRRHASVWRNLVGLPEAEVERIIRADAPDILIDLAGHAAMNCRLPLFARRLAPVQINYLGYPDTTGVPAMDFRFTDAIADPLADADCLASERLVRFAQTAWAYQPPEDAPEANPPVRPPGRPPTFGCFNYLGKISDRTLVLWSRVLGAAPGSVLILKGSGFGESAARERYLSRMERAGVDPSRVVLIERTATVAEHLALHGRIDVALDTFPYHGTTTTCEALWMGVPVVTLRGDRHVSRVGASLLGAAGHPEWVAESEAEYIRIAAGLVTDLEGLATVKGVLREDMRRSPILDHKGQAGRFGEALVRCWEDVCTGRIERPIEAEAAIF